jgi:DNA-directed RNA polymerase specialized sigma24 family protein
MQPDLCTQDKRITQVAALPELVDAFFHTVDAYQRQALEKAILDRCRALIRKLLPRYLPLWMRSDDYEECESDCLLKVWKTIRQRERGNQKPLTQGYVVRIVKNYAVSLWRHLNPHKRLLHDKARKTLATDPLAQGLTVWRTGTGKQARFVAGFVAWHDQSPCILMHAPSIHAVCKQYVEDHWNEHKADADLPSLIAGVLERANAPVLLSELVELLWECSLSSCGRLGGRPTISLEELPSEISTGLTPFELDRLYWSFDVFYQGWQRLDERHRRAFLWSQSPEFWDDLLMVKRTEDVAKMVGMKPRELIAFQKHLPLERAELAQLFNVTTGQLSSMKQHAQRQLKAWMNGTSPSNLPTFQPSNLPTFKPSNVAQASHRATHHRLRLQSHACLVARRQHHCFPLQPDQHSACARPVAHRPGWQPTTGGSAQRALRP